MTKKFYVKFTVPAELTVSGIIYANSSEDVVEYLKSTAPIESDNDEEYCLSVYELLHNEWLNSICEIEEIYVPNPEETYIDELKEIEDEEI